MNAKLCKRLRKEARKLNTDNSRETYKVLKRLAQELKHVSDIRH